MFNRRNVLASMLAIPMISISGCTLDENATDASKISSVANYLKTISSGLKTILPIISALTGISTSIVTDVTTALNVISDAATSVAKSSSLTDATSITTVAIQAINNIVNDLENSDLISASTKAIIQAAESLIPVIQTILGLIASSSATAYTYSENQAMLILMSAGK